MKYMGWFPMPPRLLRLSLSNVQDQGAAKQERCFHLAAQILRVPCMECRETVYVDDVNSPVSLSRVVDSYKELEYSRIPIRRLFQRTDEALHSSVQ